MSMALAFILTTYSSYCIIKVTLESYSLIPYDSMSELDHLGEIDIINIDTKESTETKDRTTNNNETVESSDKNNSNQSVYTIISIKALGKSGAFYGTFGFTITFATFLIGILVMNFELLTDIINVYINGYNENIIYLYIIIIVLPLIFILNWKGLTIVGWIGVIACSITTAVIFYVFVKSQIIFKQNNGSVPEYYFDGIDEINTVKYAQQEMTQIELIFFSFVTFVTSISGNGIVPIMVISSNNKSTKHLTILIIVSYVMVTIYYVLVGVIGQHIYGKNTHILILNNLFFWPQDITQIIVSIIMIINLIASYGIYSGLECDVIEGFFRIKSSEKIKRIFLRLFVLIVSAMIGFFAKHNLSLLIAIQSCVAVIFGPLLMVPFLLFTKMFWTKMSVFNRIAHVLLLLFVISVTITVAIGSLL
eukprot:328064_1